MSKIVKSARGEEVNFDVLQIKQQLADSPAPTEVAARENFVEKRLKRKLKNRTIPLTTTEDKSPDDHNQIEEI